MPSGTQLHVEQVFTDGDWAIVELRSLATAKNGMRFDNHYCWVMRFKNEMIVEVRAYLDSALVQKLIDQNPAEERSARRGQSTKPAPSRDALFTFFLTIDEGDKKK